ncbi:hypothetical protein HN51_042808 [Arachis hypogaea]|uniref:Uncharacterized protein n=1 Tax=Arachis hypogaea TaxID=3818 RepID=A0A444Y895_ARAHY|nr:uncharacterized protein LOC107613777 isoform X2 [Arachis ipaensis]XP_025672504.1 uncharacterized protein LOC112771886 isoform X2 [Arachis hypogaea]QHN94957.1 uncharacterized protein DS421_18g605520 [Arachis hypogaea]RYQ98170.1 hypothetical protein Ahy_B08g094232 [Arachis hypogaea]
MAADDTSLPSQHHQQQQQHLLSPNLPPEEFHHKEDDLIAELTHHMDRFLLQDHHHDDHHDKYDFSSQLSWDLMASPQSTLWSPLPSEASSQEPSPPPTPKGLCSYQSLIHEQIRAIELSRLKQEQVLSLKQKLMSESEDREQNHDDSLCQQQKGKGGGGGGLGRRIRPPPRPAPLLLQQQCGGGMRALFLGSSASRGGTGVFLPRAATATTPPPHSTAKQGKGCSTVLIPARVVQALQQHFDQMAATAGPKAAAFPPLHDVLVNTNRDGMYSLEKRQSRKAPIQNDMILPQEWTY